MRTALRWSGGAPGGVPSRSRTKSWTGSFAFAGTVDVCGTMRSVGLMRSSPCAWKGTAKLRMETTASFEIVVFTAPSELWSQNLAQLDHALPFERQRQRPPHALHEPTSRQVVQRVWPSWRTPDNGYCPHEHFLSRSTLNESAKKTFHFHEKVAQKWYQDAVDGAQCFSSLRFMSLHLFARPFLSKGGNPHNVRFGSWLCENAKTLNRDRRSCSFKTVLVAPSASEFNLEIELKKDRKSVV